MPEPKLKSFQGVCDGLSERKLFDQFEEVSGLGCLQFEFDEGVAEPWCVDLSLRAQKILEFDQASATRSEIRLKVEDFLALVPEAYRTLVHRSLGVGPENPQVLDFTAPLRTSQGREIWARLRRRSGIVEGTRKVIMSIEDVTLEYRRNREIQFSLERFDAVAGRIPLLMAVFDAQGNFEWVNQCWVDTLGWDLTALRSGNVFSQMYPDLDERQRAIDFIQSKATGWQEFEMKNREGRELSTTWANVRLSNGKFIGIGKDVSSAKALERTTKTALERLEFVLQNASAGVADWFVQENTIKFDRGLRQFLGQSDSVAEMNAESFESLVHPDDQREIRSKVKAVFEGQESEVEACYRMRHRNGRWIWVLSRGRVIDRDEHGRIRHISGIFIEFSRQRELEVRLHETQNTLRNYFEISVDPFCITDIHGRLRAVNPAFCRILGYREEKLVNVSTTDLLHPDDVHSTAKAFQQLALGERIQFESRVRASDGTFRTFSWHAIADEGRELIYSSIRDVTDQRNTEMKAVNATRLASLGEMASGIAHEINNPLAIIKGKCEILLHQIHQQKFQPAQGQKDLGKIIETVDRISRIVQALRVIARDSKNEELTDGNLNHIVEDVLDVSKERFRYSGVQLLWDPSAHGPALPIARCRPVQVGQAILNLLNNSFDAVSVLSDKWVKIQMLRIDEWWEISVTDSGRGVPPDVQPRLMQPFFTTKAVGQGTGIGLSVSKSMVESQGGQFFYDTDSPHTRFVVRLRAL